jgi:predicted exporter
MNFRRRQLLGWGLLASAALLGAVWLLRLDFGQKISTDVLELIPADERMPELTLVRSLASQAEARTVFIELTANGQPAPAAAATAFVEALRSEPVLRDGLGRDLFAQRFALLFPIWLNERWAAHRMAAGNPAEFPSWLAQDVAAALGRFVAAPEALAFQELIPADPLLLMPGAVDRLKYGLSLVQPANAVASPPTLVWAQLSESPLSEAGQGPAFVAIERAADAARTTVPGLQVAYTGVNRFAAASRARIEREVTWLNIFSVAAVLAVAFTGLGSAPRSHSSDCTSWSSWWVRS